jgi:DNA-binding LytR/AlgR family response regulator
MLLEDFGCDVLGPVGTIEQALDMVAGGGLDGALLDAHLDGNSSAPIAAALQTASIPFVVVTGYGALKLDDDILDSALRLIKPFSTADFGATLVAAFPPA